LCSHTTDILTTSYSSQSATAFRVVKEPIVAFVHPCLNTSYSVSLSLNITESTASNYLHTSRANNLHFLMRDCLAHFHSAIKKVLDYLRVFPFSSFALEAREIKQLVVVITTTFGVFVLAFGEYRVQLRGRIIP
jgi:hypothetical protein